MSFDEIDVSDPITDATIAISIHMSDEQNAQILKGRFSETMLRWYKNNPPTDVGDMIELDGILTAVAGAYLEENIPDAYAKLPHTHQLLEQQQRVSEYFATQLYHEHKGKKF